jgi:hypothetical protein
MKDVEEDLMEAFSKATGNQEINMLQLKKYWRLKMKYF